MATRRVMAGDNDYAYTNTHQSLENALTYMSFFDDKYSDAYWDVSTAITDTIKVLEDCEMDLKSERAASRRAARMRRQADTYGVDYILDANGRAVTVGDDIYSLDDGYIDYSTLMITRIDPSGYIHAEGAGIDDCTLTFEEVGAHFEYDTSYLNYDMLARRASRRMKRRSFIEGPRYYADDIKPLIGAWNVEWWGGGISAQDLELVEDFIDYLADQEGVFDR